MWNDSISISENGISFETPSDACTWSARAAASWNTRGISALIAEMSFRTSL